MDRGARCSHSHGHRAFVHPLSSHQIMHFQCEGTLESRRVHFVVQACRGVCSFSLWFSLSRTLDANHINFPCESVEPVRYSCFTHIPHQIDAIVRRPDLSVGFPPWVVCEFRQSGSDITPFTRPKLVDLLQRFLMEDEVSAPHSLRFSCLPQYCSASASDTRERPARKSSLRRASSDNSSAVWRSSGTENISSSK